MSDVPAGGSRHEEHGIVRQELDRVPALPVVLLILASLALIAIGVVWPWAILSGSVTPRPVPRLGVAPRVVQPQPRIIGGVPASGAAETVFDLSAERPWSAAPAEGAGGYPPSTDPLERFDWADRERGTVELPIDVAVELWLARQASGRDGTQRDRDAEGSTSPPTPDDARASGVLSGSEP